jgi:mannosyltransferase OCH1-like enzyme
MNSEDSKEQSSSEPIIESLQSSAILDTDAQKEIPKIIYICHKNIECLNMTHKFWKRLNPTYQIKLFDNARCEKFLLEQFSELHQSVFNFIPDGPIKSDFWRVCIIYKYGGIYVDADIHPLVPLNEFLSHDSDFVTCITKHNRNFNPHFIAARKNDPILKMCIEEYIIFYNKRSYAYWDWSIVHIFNRKLSHVKDHHNKMPRSQVFIINNKKYQLFFEMTIHDDTTKKHTINDFLKIKPQRLHDYYCSFLNKRIFNTRYNNYDPYDHSFKNYDVKNRKTIFNALGLRVNVKKISKIMNIRNLKLL